MIKRNHPSWYVPGAPMDIGDALKHLDDVEPDGPAAAYQDALEAIHTHIRRMGARYAALFSAVERARAELAPANVNPSEPEEARVLHTISGPLDISPELGSYFKRPWDPAPPLFNVNADPPVYPSWTDIAGLSTVAKGQVEPWSDEQFAKIKAEWEGFAHPTGRHPEGGCPCVDEDPPDPACPFHGVDPREGLGPGHPECPTCERRVQEGEQPPFPTAQARQWINHGGRVWTRLCEACRALEVPPGEPSAPERLHDTAHALMNRKYTGDSHAEALRLEVLTMLGFRP
jgi:hypothetical protein